MPATLANHCDTLNRHDATSDAALKLSPWIRSSMCSRKTYKIYETVIGGSHTSIASAYLNGDGGSHVIPMVDAKYPGTWRCDLWHSLENQQAFQITGIGLREEVVSLCLAVWVHRIGLPTATMSRLFKNKRKKSPESSLQATFPTIPTDVTTGPASHQTQSNLGPEGEQTPVQIKVQG